MDLLALDPWSQRLQRHAPHFSISVPIQLNSPSAAEHHVCRLGQDFDSGPREDQMPAQTFSCMCPTSWDDAYVCRHGPP